MFLVTRGASGIGFSMAAQILERNHAKTMILFSEMEEHGKLRKEEFWEYDTAM